MARAARQRLSSGVEHLDELLGGLFIGDNVVWFDDAGSLAPVFCLNFLRISREQGKPLVYVSFDRSPKNLLDKLGPLAEYEGLTILDCFTGGKGAGSEIFLKFYEEGNQDLACRIIKAREPGSVEGFMEELYALHATLRGDVRFIFESLTGMRELWGSEERILSFYGHSCPRLYELNTVAYWIVEKNAHTSQFRAQISQIAQVTIELAVKRGITSLAVLKAESRSLQVLHKPQVYWIRDHRVTFEEERRPAGPMDLGRRLKEFRTHRGLSQAELAKLVGVTASTISQVESNLIYPSLPALLKMAEVLAVSASSFFQDHPQGGNRMIFSPGEASDVKLPGSEQESISVRLLIPVDFNAKTSPYLIELAPRAELPGHFFFHKGEEWGLLISGKLQVKVGAATHTLKPGEVIYLTDKIPTAWCNPGPGAAKLLWVLVK
jgi:transcriptional regulator with XRE-family HTH domain/KaiC/GvpD/RAD55 family RecA-like ATPase